MSPTQTPTDPGVALAQGTSRSWFRRVRLRTWIILSAILVVIVSPLFYRQYRISQIPVIPEPFDLQEFAARYSIPGSENAFVQYIEATSKSVEQPQWNDLLNSLNITRVKWENSPLEVKAAVKANEDALEVWMKGTLKPRSVIFPPDQLKIDTQLIVLQIMRRIDRVAHWKQIQLQDEGNLEESWKLIDAGQRTALHLMQGTTMIERRIGMGVHMSFTSHLSRWSEDPDVSVKLLRSALANLRDHQRSIPPVSDTLKSEFFLLHSPGTDLWDAMNFNADHASQKSLRTQIVKNVQSPLMEFGLWVIGEYELSRRYLRQLTANWIKHVDLPPRERRAREVTSGVFLIFKDQEQSEVFLTPEKLDELGQKTIIAKSLVPATREFLSVCDVDRFKWSAEELILALQIYYRVHGEFPKDLSLLVPEILERLPENPYGDESEALIQYRVEKDHAVIWSEGEYKPVPLDAGPEYILPADLRSRQTGFYFTIYPPGTRAPLYRPYPPGFEEELKKKKEEGEKKSRQSGGLMLNVG